MLTRAAVIKLALASNRSRHHGAKGVGFLFAVSGIDSED